MNKILIALGLIMSGTLFAQNDPMNKWSISYGVGSHLWTKPVSSHNANLQNFQVSHHHLDGRYMFNNRLGLQLDVNYDFFDFKGLGKRNTHYISTTLQSVVNLGDIIKLYTLHERFGLLFHTGVGYATMWQSNVEKKDHDNMMLFKAGLTPQLRLTDHWSLFADATWNATYKQSVTYDFEKKIGVLTTPYARSAGFFFNLSIGATYYIGKNKKHADWTKTTYNESETVDLTPYDQGLERLKSKINDLEDQLKDDDGDGVVNKYDKEPNTPKGAIVNSLGQEIKLPVDTDGDGIPDNIDECPTEPGKMSNNGCPVSKEQLKIIREVSEAIYFETGKAVIKQASFPAMNKLVAILKANEDVALSIEGHTDNVGSDEKNLQLSKDRAAAVRDYIVSRGIKAERIKSEGFGSTKPIADNSTELGRSQNRRVVINTSAFNQTFEVETR